MDSAGIRNTGQGQASYVEECRCPAGYTGLSCEVHKFISVTLGIKIIGNLHVKVQL